MNTIVAVKKPRYFIMKKYTIVSTTETMNCTGLKPANTSSAPLSTPNLRAEIIIWIRYRVVSAKSRVMVNIG